MGFIDDLKTDQRTQMLVAGIVFFSLAFPLYFNYAASNVDEFEASGPIGNYSVEGTYSFHEIASGSQYIDDGSTIEITANSDAAGDEIKGKNLVGVRATLTYTDDESGGGLGCVGYQTADDQVSASLEYPEMMPTNGQVLSGESLAVEWHISDLVDTTVSNMSESGIRMLLDGDGMGLGEHYLDISVDVAEGGGTGVNCQTSDNGEEVAYVIELISLEYTITAVE
ncbi:MAG: hypothetical protein MKZ58_01835 [Candidatus Poseidoniaceae archaeon]|nr:hypothetical protein [Candidatus Poseidoniaceae archaeon]